MEMHPLLRLPLPLLLAGVVACEAPVEPPEDAPRYLTSARELLTRVDDPSDLDRWLADQITAFGHMSYGCSATHVGGGVVVTAGHCYYGVDDFGHGYAEDLPCGDLDLVWGWTYDQGRRRPAPASRCTRILAVEYDDDADFAIFRVDVPPAGSIDVELGAAPPPPNRALTMIGHPSGTPLRTSGRCRFRSVDGDWFFHGCDAEGGSSGSGLIDLDTRRLIGVHDGWWGSSYYGTLASAGAFHRALLKFAAAAPPPAAPAPPPAAPLPSLATVRARVQVGYFDPDVGPSGQQRFRLHVSGARGELEQIVRVVYDLDPSFGSGRRMTVEAAGDLLFTSEWRSTYTPGWTTAGTSVHLRDGRVVALGGVAIDY